MVSLVSTECTTPSQVTVLLGYIDLGFKNSSGIIK